MTEQNEPYRTTCPKCGARRIDAQLGLEETPSAYVAAMVAVFGEVRRILRKDGVLFLNCGDSYYGGKGANGSSKARRTAAERGYTQSGGTVLMDTRPLDLPQDGLKPKDLVGIPWMLAFALRDDGWWLRQDIIWSKPNPMPESVTDRCTKAHEYIFLLTKRAQYYWDQEAVKETSEGSPNRAVFRGGGSYTGGNSFDNDAIKPSVDAGMPQTNSATRNPRSVWTIPTQSFPGAHFATFPEAIPERCIKAGTSERGCCPKCGTPWRRVVERPKPPREVFSQTRKPADGFVNRIDLPGGGIVGSGQKLQNWLNANPPTTTGWRAACKCNADDPVPCTVLDPFCGSATTLAVAAQLGRHAIGIELNPEYAAMGERRIAQAVKPSTHRTDAAADAPLFEDQS